MYFFCYQSRERRRCSNGQANPRTISGFTFNILFNIFVSSRVVDPVRDPINSRFTTVSTQENLIRARIPTTTPKSRPVPKSQIAASQLDTPEACQMSTGCLLLKVRRMFAGLSVRLSARCEPDCPLYNLACF